MPQLQRPRWDEPELQDPILEETPRSQRQLAMNPPFKIADERIQRRLQDTGWLWSTIRAIPGVQIGGSLATPFSASPASQSALPSS